MADSVAPGQTARMRRLIRAYTVRVCPKVIYRVKRPVYLVLCLFASVLSCLTSMLRTPHLLYKDVYAFIRLYRSILKHIKLKSFRFRLKCIMFPLNTNKVIISIKYQTS